MQSVVGTDMNNRYAVVCVSHPYRSNQKPEVMEVDADGKGIYQVGCYRVVDTQTDNKLIAMFPVVTFDHFRKQMVRNNQSMQYRLATALTQELNAAHC
jgi:hypothetical protein